MSGLRQKCGKWLSGALAVVAATLPLTGWSVERDLEQAVWNLQTSLYTVHYSPDPEHNNHQRLLGVERHSPDASLWGVATFKHSFGERANYGYYGKRFVLGESRYHLKLTGGLLQGYKGKYRNKIPLNHLGVAPAIVPSLGASFSRVSTEVVLLGGAAAMATVGIRL